MAWSTPKTWIVSELIDDTIMNSAVRDNLAYLKGTSGVIYLESPTELAESATPATPSSGRGRIFIGNGTLNNGIASSVDDAGVVYQMLRYADGTFTPSLAGSSVFGTFTYDTANTKAQYTRIGNRIFVNGRVIVTATSVAPAGNVSIGGLPFASGSNANNGNILGSMSIVWSGINLVAGYTTVEGMVFSAATSMVLYESGDNVARVAVQGNEFSSTFDIFFNGFYKVD